MPTATGKASKNGRPPTLQDIAAEVGVTKATVSYALSGKATVAPRTRKAVLQAAKRLGYEVNLHAQTLSRGHSSLVGLFSLSLDFGVGTQKLNLMQQMLMEHGYTVPVYVYGHSVRDAVDHSVLLGELCRQKPRAIVCDYSRLPESALDKLRQYARQGGVLVGYNYPREIEGDQVTFDQEDNTYQAARHLLEQGHRKIAFVMHGEVDSKNPRLPGFARALQAYGLTPRPEWVLGTGMIAEEAGAELAARFMALPERPTGICIVNDGVAAAFVNEIRRFGLRVPQDVSVVGHDDLPIARAGGPIRLTTVSHPVEAIATQVVEFLHSRLEGQYDGPARRVALRGELRIRDSVQPMAP
jgi:LacI family transcriptional regulator